MLKVSHKKLRLLAVSALILPFVACLNLTKTEEGDTGDIQLDENMASTITVGDTLAIAGTVEASGEISGFNYRFVDGDGDTVQHSAKLFVWIDTNITERAEEWNLADDEGALIITNNKIGKMTCGGTYTLIIDAAVDGGIVATKTHEFTIEGPTCDEDGNIIADVTLDSVSMGAQAASPGSALDLDAFEALTKDDAEANSEDIDIFLAYFSGSGDVELITPKAAAAYQNLFPAEWGTTHATAFYKTGLGTDFDKIKSQYEIDALWDANAPKVSSSSFSKGNVFIAKSDQGKITLFRIDSISSTGTSTVVGVSGYN